MKNKINFLTGESYFISELLSGAEKIQIPDLQRDYCWGNEAHSKEKKELVSDFINSLISQFEEFENKENCTIDPLNLGMIYGYESPTYHMQLCDGQQRITTIFLLLGILNRYSGNNMFKNYLVIDANCIEDQVEPRIIYSIRESSLYFMIDLVSYFFITNESETSDNRYYIKKLDDLCSPEENLWYFKEYDNDPTIQSIIRSLRKIDDICQKLQNKNLIFKFGDFILHKVAFLYYDMGNRANGEETFVVINTTGEPLTATQNLKPLIILEKINGSEKNLAEEWEKMEGWFWQRRDKDNGNDTADSGFCEFLRWVTIIFYTKKNNEATDENEIKEIKEKIEDILKTGKYSFPYTEVSFAEILEYWESVKYIFGDNCPQGIKYDKKLLSPKKNAVPNQIDYFKLLPIIEYCKTHKMNNTQCDKENLFRYYKFFENLARMDNVSKASRTLICDAIKITTSCKDVIDLLNNHIKISETILTPEEKHKLEILKNNINNRHDIEEAFWENQDTEIIKNHNIWAGEILPLISWGENDGIFDIEKFNRYAGIFDNVFTGPMEHEADLLRRALLAYGIKNYPHPRGRYLTFGWEWSDWHEIVNENKEIFKNLLDYIIDNKEADRPLKEQIDQFYNAIIDNADPDIDYYDFIKDNGYLMSLTHSSTTCDILRGNSNEIFICDGGSSARHTSFISKTDALRKKTK